MKTNMQNLKIEHPPSRQTTSECYILRTIVTATNWARGQRTLHINVTNSATFSSAHPRELSISRDKLPNYRPYHSYPLYTLETHRENGSIDNKRISDSSSNRQRHNNFSDGTILQRCHLGMFYVNHTSTVSTEYEDVVGLFLVSSLLTWMTEEPLRRHEETPRLPDVKLQFQRNSSHPVGFFSVLSSIKGDCNRVTGQLFFYEILVTFGYLHRVRVHLRISVNPSPASSSSPSSIFPRFSPSHSFAFNPRRQKFAEDNQYRLEKSGASLLANQVIILTPLP